MNDVLTIPTGVVNETLASLKAAGVQRHEGVVLWLGRRERAARVTVVEAYVPDQEADDDYFRIPPASMAALLRHLGETNTFLAAQVHSHPREAFHSRADDDWAIVRHLGALSLVVPHFATRTVADTFVTHCAAFRLSERNSWDELSDEDRARTLQV